MRASFPNTTRKDAAVAWLLLGLGFGAFPLAAATPHNILLVIADDYGVDSSVLYNSTNTGASLPPTPNILSIAHDGVVFRNAYANPVCSPTRACLLTGQFGFRTGIGDVVDNGPALTASAFTLPEAFATNSSSGYHLAQFGKWHLAFGANSPRTIGGWTNFAGSIPGAVPNYTNWTKTVNGAQTANYTNYATTDLVNDASTWIQARGTNPWFAWIAFNAPHTPLHLPPTNLCPHYATLPGTTADINNRPDLYFDAMIEALDTELGRLLSAVNRSNTHIIFMGDNGTAPNTLQPPFPSNRGKDTLYEGGIHVPFIVSGPAVVSPGRTNDTPVSAVDVFSTILEMAGFGMSSTVPSNVVIDSQSLIPPLQSTNILNRYAYSELFGTNIASNVGGRALRNSQFKLIQFTDHHQELYDLAADPYEAVNLLNSPLSASQQSNYYALELRLSFFQTNGPPTISSLTKSNAQLNITVQHATNLTSALWRSPDLTTLSWTPLTNAVLKSNSPISLTLTDTNASAGKNFYVVTTPLP